MQDVIRRLEKLENNGKINRVGQEAPIQLPHSLRRPYAVPADDPTQLKQKDSTVKADLTISACDDGLALVLERLKQMEKTVKILTEGT